MASPRITFRCSAEHRALAERRAERESGDLSVAMRALLADYVAGRKPSLELARRFETLAKDLRAIGVNLNQATRALNSGTFPNDLVPLLRKLARAVRTLGERFADYGVPRKP